MTGFTDLVLQAQPALAEVHATVTVGRTWRWTFTDVADAAGTPVDLTAVPGACTIYRPDSTALATPTVIGRVGGFTVEMSETATAAIAPGYYSWGLVLDNGPESVQVWGPSASRLMIQAQA